MNYLLDAIEESIEKYKKNKWSGLYRGIQELTPDARGNVGEIMIFEKLLPNAGFENIIFNKDKTVIDDNTYDGIVNGKKIEIKTATIGSNKSNNFQHENFYLDNTGADIYILLDICEDKYLLSVFTKDDIMNMKILLNINLHSRHTTGAKKLTLSRKKLETKSVEIGKTIVVDEETDDITISNFIRANLI